MLGDDITYLANLEFIDFDMFYEGPSSVFDDETTLSDRIPKAGYLACFCLDKQNQGEDLS
jgi:hypothetical protein